MQREVLERNGRYSAVLTTQRDGKPWTSMHSLNTKDRKVAEAAQAKVNQLMTLVEMGQKEIPAGVDLWDWLLKFGGEQKKVEKAKNETTLDTIINDFIAGRTKKADSTQKLDAIYARHLRRFLSREKKNSFLTTPAFTLDLIKEYRTFRYGEGVRVVTVNKELSWLFTLYSDQKKHFPADPFEDFVYDKDDTDPARWKTAQEIKDELKERDYSKDDVAKMWQGRFYTKAEIGRFLKLAKEQDPELFTMLCVAAFTGSRRSEIARMRWSDVSWGTKIVTIKGFKGSRSTKVTPREIEMHQILLDALKAQKLLTGRSEYVFPAENGQANEPRLMTKRLNRLVRGTEFDLGVGWHKFRHSLITHMASDGEDQRRIDKTVGHVSESMRRRYAHVTAEDKQAAAQTLKGIKVG